MCGKEYQVVKNIIEKELLKGIRKFIIYPFGKRGSEVKRILNESYGIEASFLIDNHLAKFNHNIKDISYLQKIDIKKYTILLSVYEIDLAKVLIAELEKYISNANFIDIFASVRNITKTKKGKYSYGPLCSHILVEKVGAFCSFAGGTDVVPNHAMKYISTHLFLATDPLTQPGNYDDYINNDWYFPGISPKETIGLRRSIIGNDVWLGRNVILIGGG